VRSKFIWQGEDERVAAAKSLSMIDPERGYRALVRTAVKPDVGNFNIFNLLAQGAVRNPATRADYDAAIAALADFASNTKQDGFYRILIANLLLRLDAHQGVLVFENMVRDPTLDSPHRMECITLLLSIDLQRGVGALDDFIADPRADLHLRFSAINQLWALDPNGAQNALERVAFGRTNSAFARSVASMKLRPAVGQRALLALSEDENVSAFHRITPLTIGGMTQQPNELVRLSSDPTISAEWRLFAAEELVGRDPIQGIIKMREVAKAPNVRWRVRMRATSKVIIYRLLYRLSVHGFF
jgi:hypothetical protein